MMKDVRIFIASSRELIQERNELAFLVLAKEEEFAQRGLRVRLAKWEYVDPKMTAGRTEDRYLDEMYNCDAAMVIFKNVAGMYTREELDKALAREAAGTDRIKAHKILFSAEGRPDSDAAKFRASLPEENYCVYTNLEELKAAFLTLVDEVSRSECLVDAQDENLHEVSAFVAADDEMASDRNAFADTILNLNDILARRGVHVRMRFYDPEHHRELLESSEMALVLYDTNYRAFNPEQMHDAYGRTKREENPKRLYVFFRDEEESKLDQAFVEFRNGFAENLGHFFCRFENADTLKLNFLLSLENVLGDGVAFVKLDGRKIKADEFEVGEITSLPLVKNNGGINDLLARADKIATDFAVQRETCRKNPDDMAAYKILLTLSMKKNEVEAEVGMELSRSFELVKRMSAISVKEANMTMFQARQLLDAGRIDEAVELLDGTSSALDDILCDVTAFDDVVEQKLKTLESWIDVELFRADTMLAFAKLTFQDRFVKVERLFKSLLMKFEAVLRKYRPKSLIKVLCQFADIYSGVGDTLSPISLWEKVLELFRVMDLDMADTYSVAEAKVKMKLAGANQANNSLEEAEALYVSALDVFRSQGESEMQNFARCLCGLATLHRVQGRFEEAEREHAKALEIRRHWASVNPTMFDADVAWSLSSLATVHNDQNRLKEAEREREESLEIRRRLAAADPDKYEEDVAWTLNGLATLYRRRLAEANPGKLKASVAWSLNCLATLHMMKDDLDLATAEFDESLKLRETLAAENPDKFNETLAETLHEQAKLLIKEGDMARAKVNLSRAYEMRRALAAISAEKFAEDLEDTKVLLATVANT